MRFIHFLFCKRFLSFGRVLSFGLVLGFLLTGFAGNAMAARKSAAMAIDAHSGRILYSHNIDKPHHPASLTKVMTLYMLFEYIKSGRLDLNSKLKVTAHAAGMQPSKLGLKAGSFIKVEDAIKALIVKSANDVAVTIAENLSGSEWKFAQHMTMKARKLGMHKSRFMNASGLPNSKQITTARDMITLCMRIQKDFPHFYPFFSTRTFTYNGRTYKSYNRLLGRVKGVDGIKTGYTRASGFNLTSSVWRGRKHVVAVVLGGKTSKRRDAFMKRLLNKSLRRAKNGARKKHVMIAKAKRPVAKPYVQPAKKVVQRKRVVVTQDSKSKSQFILAEGSSDGPIAQTATADEIASQQGPYHIQIGAFGSQEDAKRRLHSIGSKAGSLLKGHSSFTMLSPNNSVYRARFAGFSELDARKTCKQLKKYRIDCLAVSAQ